MNNTTFTLRTESGDGTVLEKEIRVTNKDILIIQYPSSPSRLLDDQVARAISEDIKKALEDEDSRFLIMPNNVTIKVLSIGSKKETPKNPYEGLSFGVGPHDDIYYLPRNPR